MDQQPHAVCRRLCDAIPVVETPRLVLRAFCGDDFEAYAQLCADPEVMRFLGAGEPLGREDAWRNLAVMAGHWSLRGFGPWAAVEKASGEFVGRIGFFEPQGWPDFELGWVLARPYWKRGLATEAAKAALEFAFTTLRRRRVISLIRPQNAASIRVAERIGEHLDGSVQLMGKEALIYAISS